MRDKEAFAKAVDGAASYSEVLEKLGLRAAGGNYKQLHKWAKIHDIALPQVSGIDRTRAAREKSRLSDAEVFCENSRASRVALRKRINAHFPNRCALCGITEWLDEPIVLHIDHINGIWNDNRIENLRRICPNCHSQTDTYCGRNKAIRSGFES
jgi:hypothetical protein